MRWLAIVVAFLGFAGPVSAQVALPLGDGRIASEPRPGAVFVCSTRFGGGGADRAGPWVKGNQWYPDQKPTVAGRVAWPNGRIAVAIEGSERVVTANNLPRHPAGTFPIARDDPAYAFDRNPNAIREQNVLLRLPITPVPVAQPGCLPMGMIGFALTGVAIYNALDARGRDAPAYEVQDACAGHPERGGQYHYHDLSPCLPDPEGGAGRHSSLLGFALDGFGIYGVKGESGRDVTNADLDVCHGHSHEVPWDGERRTIYHYHFTREYPYTLGCFRGAVDAAMLRRDGPPPASR